MTDLSMVDLIYVLETLRNCGTRVKKTSRTRGGNYNGLCPECGDRNGLYVLPDAVNEQGQREGKWACRTCHQKESDALGMLVHYDKLTYSQAFARLRELYPDLPNSNNYKKGSNYPPAPAQVRIKPLSENAVPPSQEWQARATKVLAASQKWLWGDQGKEARRYLFERGLTEETIKAAGLGFLWLDNGQDAIRERPSIWGLDADQYESGIYLPSGIVLPYFYKGEIWKLRIRRLGDNIPQNERYSMVSGGSNGLYSADDIKSDQPALVFEGEIDALSAKQAMDNTIACVATGGTTQARIPLWLSKLVLASCVLICFDNDKKSETTAGAIKYWKDRLVRSKVYPVPPAYKDVNAMLCAGGDIRRWVLSGLGQDTPRSTDLHQPSIPLQGKRIADLTFLLTGHRNIFMPAEVLQIAITLSQIGVVFSGEAGMIAAYGPFPFTACPQLTKEDVIRFVLAHEPALFAWMKQGAPGAVKERIHVYDAASLTQPEKCVSTQSEEYAS